MEDTILLLRAEIAALKAKLETTLRRAESAEHELDVMISGIEGLLYAPTPTTAEDTTRQLQMLDQGQEFER